MSRIGTVALSLAAFGALGYLAAMTLLGAQPVQRQYVEFEAKGVLALEPEAVRRVTLTRDGRSVTLTRTGGNAWAQESGGDVAQAAGTHLDTAVKMLHRSGPVRELEADELAGVDTAPFGLEQPTIVVSVFGEGVEPVLTARFGRLNPEGFLQYMRIVGDPHVYLMSRFIGAEWVAALEGVDGK